MAIVLRVALFSTLLYAFSEGQSVSDKLVLIQVKWQEAGARWQVMSIFESDDLISNKPEANLNGTVQQMGMKISDLYNCLEIRVTRNGTFSRRLWQRLDLKVLDNVTFDAVEGDGCLCKGKQIKTDIKDPVWWHGCGKKCHGSWNFGLSNSGDPRASCGDSLVEHWGHFYHNASANSSYYTFGTDCWDASQQKAHSEFQAGDTWELVASYSNFNGGGGGSSQDQAAHAYADPHCQNLKGELFDIRAFGAMTLIKIPRESSLEETGFAIVGVIEGSSDEKCGQTYLSKVEFVGSRLGVPQFSVTVGSGGPEVHNFVGAGGMEAGNGAKVTLAPGSAQYSSKSWKAGNTTLSTYTGDDGVAGVAVQVGPYELVISQHQDEKNNGWDFLNLDMFGMQSTGENIGGLLGEDDHGEASAIPVECRALAEGVATMNRETGADTTTIGGTLARLKSSLSAK